MYKNILTVLKRLKYNLSYLFKSTINMPDKQNKFNYVETDIKNFVNNYFENDDLSFPVSPTHDNIGMHVFGSEIENHYDYEYLAFDDFNKVSFSKKSFKPAFFNKGDVKVSFEKSRLQYHQKQNKYNPIPKYFKEFGKNFRYPQIFWNSPMDVAIRNINLIFHLFALEGSLETSKILGNNKELLSSYISEHYEFIISNLENKGNVVGNHYLIELTSILLTIASFNFEHDKKEFLYYENELNSELNKQFYKDGTSFEGSTHYAAFVTEALIICKLAIEEINSQSKVLPKIDEIITTNKIFLKKLMINGELSQVGDNDSGRLFYFEFDEEAPLQMTWLINLIDKLYPKFDWLNIEQKFNFEIKSKTPSLEQMPKVSHKKIKIFTKDYESYCFNDFGLYVWRNNDEFFSLRCGTIGQNGIGGHSHYDQLSIESYSNSRWITRDPGTGTYTDDINIRNKFRSLEYHWGPKANIKIPKEDEFDCFRLNYMGDGHTLIFNKNNFLGYAEFNGKRIYRKISIHDGEVLIEDFSKDVDLEEYTSWGEDNNGIKVLFSNGYKRIN